MRDPDPSIEQLAEMMDSLGAPLGDECIVCSGKIEYRRYLAFGVCVSCGAEQVWDEYQAAVRPALV